MQPLPPKEVIHNNLRVAGEMMMMIRTMDMRIKTRRSWMTNHHHCWRDTMMMNRMRRHHH